MTSDWRVIDAPLGKLSCAACGLVFRDPRLPQPADFAAGYELYAHAAGTAAEQMRQSAYAAWIAASVSSPRRVLDVGCGNGSLLLALREHWPHAELTGCDPSPAAIRHATNAGLMAWIGTAADLPARGDADLVISVNVIEHTPDPRAFITALRQTLSAEGALVLICPDGAIPGVDLLIADHLYSFTAPHLDAVLEAAGLVVTQWSPAPPRLGTFQMVVAVRRGAKSSAGPPAHEVLALRHAQQEYLRAWQDLDAGLMQRLPSDVVCFGAGEAAGLLRAYAPGTWARVRMCTTDEPGSGTFGSLRRVPLGDVASDATVLVGVRPQDQDAVAERLRTTFRRVVTWYDLVSSDDAR